jgi:hypothetical protein
MVLKFFWISPLQSIEVFGPLYYRLLYISLHITMMIDNKYRQHLASPQVFDGIRVANHFSFLWFFLFLFVLCLVCPMLPMSLDYPFLIALSVFSNVYV